MLAQERQVQKNAARWIEKPDNGIPCKKQPDLMKAIVQQGHTSPAAFCLRFIWTLCMHSLPDQLLPMLKIQYWTAAQLLLDTRNLLHIEQNKSDCVTIFPQQKSTQHITQSKRLSLLYG